MRYSLVFGSIAGAVIVALSGIVFAITQGLHSTSPLVGYLVMLAALSMIFVGVKRYRDIERGGVIRFVPALALGLGIALVAAIIYVIAWEITYASVGADFLAQYSDVMAREMREAGASEREIQKAVIDMREFGEEYANPLVRVPMTFAEIAPVGVVVALISAALLRNPRLLPARAG